jgi:DNA-binding NtrC family response regulator
MKWRVLLVDDDATFTEDMLLHLGERFEFMVLHDGGAVIPTVRDHLPDVVLLDIELGSEPDGLDVLSQMRDELPRVPVVMVTRHDPAEMGAEAWRRGAFGYIAKSCSIEEIAARIRRALEEATAYRERQALREEVQERVGQLIGESRAMRQVREIIGQVAPTDSTVLITGETGTGKELIARAIHEQSSRRDHLFVPVACPAIPEPLVESELFGHERGAFTGATVRKIGKFQIAHKGTLFLDEIGEIPLSVQAKLLRALEERKFSPVGDTREIEVDVRILAATNRDLEAEVAKGKFRADLYYRLRVVPIHMPPLRERREDIPILAQHMLDLMTRNLNKPRSRLSARALDRFFAWGWKGNVRELRNVLECALVRSMGEVLDEDLFIHLVCPDMARLTYKDARKQFLDQFDKDYAYLILRECDWNVSMAAKRMGLTREGLRRLMKRLGINRPTD